MRIGEKLTTLADAVERHTITDGEHETSVSALTLFRRSQKSEFLAFVYEPSLCIVVQGAKEVVLANDKYRHDAAHTLLVSVDLPVMARVVQASLSRPCLMLRITIDPGVVAELLPDGAVSAPDSSAARALGVGPFDPQLLDAVTRLVSLLDSPQDVAPLAPLLLREITYRVLTGPHGPRLRQLATSGAPVYRISRAVRWLKDHFADTIQIESLARRVRMSPSAFHLHFKNVTAMTPLQYQKRLRLQEARRLMLSEGLEAAEAAFNVGYESPSQFSREYRRMFGTPPRQDVESLKANSR